MSDTERVFALYVQINPVPEPDLLPFVRDEAALPTTEGSTVMDTRERTEAREQIEIRTPQRAGRWRPVTVVAAAFVAVLAVVGGALVLTGDDDVVLVAAGDARPVVTWDGESATYTGPTGITEGELEFTIVNNGSQEITLGVWSLTDPDGLAAELDRTPVGSDMSLGPSTPVPDGDLVILESAPAGATITVGPTNVNAGTLLVDLVTATSGFNDHVWRPAMIEVVEP